MADVSDIEIGPDGEPVLVDGKPALAAALERRLRRSAIYARLYRHLAVRLRPPVAEGLAQALKDPGSQVRAVVDAALDAAEEMLSGFGAPDFGSPHGADLWAAPADIVKVGAEPKSWIVMSTSFPTANPPFHRDCHCVLDDGRISVGGACVSGDCDCRAVDGLQAGSQEALAWAAQRKGG